MLRPPPRQHQRHQHHHRAHRRGRDQVHRPPAEFAGDQRGDRPRQQDADQHPAHDGADALPAPVFRREMRGERQDHLRPDGREAEQERRGDEDRGVWCCRRNQQARDQAAEHQKDQRLVFDEIAERHQEQQSQHVAELDHGDDQAGGGDIEPKRGADGADQRLGIVEIGDGDAAGDRQRQDQPRAGTRVLDRSFRRFLQHGGLSQGLDGIRGAPAYEARLEVDGDIGPGPWGWRLQRASSAWPSAAWRSAARRRCIWVRPSALSMASLTSPVNSPDKPNNLRILARASLYP